ncbi:MAG: hypothetical protein K2G04_00370 [Oscillospiraceae bacterium]|nr:hypothetical protein [Oscillospiraceae bacterium]
MKKILLSCLLTAILSVLLAGCAKEDTVGEKLCRIEVSDALEHSRVAVLEQQSQSDVSAFFDENNWTEITENSVDLTPKYVISLYQEKTPTVIKSKNDEPYEKIMEYTTYENSETVKVSIGGDVVNNAISDEFLSGYYIGSDKFFSALSDLSDASKG